jgi:hypothetical protein
MLPLNLHTFPSAEFRSLDLDWAWMFCLSWSAELLLLGRIIANQDACRSVCQDWWFNQVGQVGSTVALYC